MHLLSTKRSMSVRKPFRYAWMILLFGLALHACSDKETGILLRITLAEESPDLEGGLDSLELFVAVRLNGEWGYQFDEGASGTKASIVGRNLRDDPFELLLRDNDDGVMENVKLFVMAYRGETLSAWGELEDPDEQQFVKGKVVERSLYLRSMQSDPPPFFTNRTGCFLLDSGEVYVRAADDFDCDGVVASEDCNDEDPTIHPGAMEICGNGVDDNCDNVTDEEVDRDGDNFTNCDGDCNDEDDTVYPDAPELCDGKDNDCNGWCDDPFDKDGDMFTSCENEEVGTKILPDGACVHEPVAELFDCRDDDETVHPEAFEECDGKDNNCDGLCDEGHDDDGDGFNTCGSKRGLASDATMCTPPHADFVDCRDDEFNIHPLAVDICDGHDTDCRTEPDGESQICLVLATEQGEPVCRIGQRICDDLNGSGWGGCEIAAINRQVPLELCEKYTECLITHPQNPMECVGGEITWVEGSCAVLSPEEGEVCGTPPLSGLPVDTGLTECTWYLVNPHNSPGWSFHLYEWDDSNVNWIPTGSKSETCVAALAALPPVASGLPWTEGEVGILLVAQPNDVLRFYHVMVSVVPNHPCEGTGMSCIWDQ